MGLVTKLRAFARVNPVSKSNFTQFDRVLPSFRVLKEWGLNWRREKRKTRGVLPPPMFNLPSRKKYGDPIRFFEKIPPPPHTHTKKREENLFFSIPHSSLNGPRRGKLRNKEDEGEVCNYNGTIRISTPLPPYTHAQKKRMNAVTLKNRLSSFTKRTEPSRKRVWLRMWNQNTIKLGANQRWKEQEIVFVSASWCPKCWKPAVLSGGKTKTRVGKKRRSVRTKNRRKRLRRCATFGWIISCVIRFVFRSLVLFRLFFLLFSPESPPASRGGLIAIALSRCDRVTSSLLVFFGLFYFF